MTIPAPDRVQAAATAWPADRVERWDIARLTPYARNARTHSDEQVAQIAASIEAFGFTNPVLADETGTIIAGHGRVLAAQRLGLADIPVMVARGWSAAQIRAYLLADNKLALNAGWDTATLALELGELNAMGFDLALTGFSDAEIADLRQPVRWGRPHPRCRHQRVTDRDVPPTNNISERHLRPSVIFRKVTNGFRSEWGAEAYAAFRSMGSTAKLTGRSVLDATRNALFGYSLVGVG